MVTKQQFFWGILSITTALSMVANGVGLLGIVIHALALIMLWVETREGGKREQGNSR